MIQGKGSGPIAQLITVGPGVYAVLGENGRGYALNGDGDPYVLDLRAFIDGIPPDPEIPGGGHAFYGFGFGADLDPDGFINSKDDFYRDASGKIHNIDLNETTVPADALHHLGSGEFQEIVDDPGGTNEFDDDVDEPSDVFEVGASADSLEGGTDSRTPGDNARVASVEPANSQGVGPGGRERRGRRRR